MEYELGSIEVTAEFRDERAETVDCLSDVEKRYSGLCEIPKEHFYAVFLKSDNEVIGDKLISLGGTGNTPLDVKDIGRTAVLVNASAVILVHNHPSTNNRPTEDDKEVTRRIQEALELFDIQVLDHVIISQNDYYSMRKSNDLQTT